MRHKNQILIADALFPIQIYACLKQKHQPCFSNLDQIFSMKDFLTFKEKFSIVLEAYAVPRNVRHVARVYGIDEKQIRRWREIWLGLSVEERENVKNKKTAHGGRPSNDNDINQDLREYFTIERSFSRRVTPRSLVRQAAAMKPALLLLTKKAQTDRIRRFCYRHDLTQRRRTHIAQRNVHYTDADIADFPLFVDDQMRINGIARADVVNIDETNIDFDCISADTLEVRGSKTISIAGNGSSNRCTILLGVTGNGVKLPPFIIFKGTHDGRIARTELPTLPAGAFYAVQTKAWIDQRGFNKWIQDVWVPFTATRPRTYLLMDHFAVHKTAESTAAIQLRGTRIDLILEGCTSKLQVLDVGINKPFKDRMRDQCEDFTRTADPGVKPTRRDIATWALNAWEGITPAMINNTWRHAGFFHVV